MIPPRHAVTHGPGPLSRDRAAPEETGTMSACVPTHEEKPHSPRPVGGGD